MDEMLSYVFSGLQRNENHIRALNRNMKQQMRLNFRFLILFGCAFYSIHMKDKKTKTQMRIMAKELDKLKEEKEGE